MLQTAKYAEEFALEFFSVDRFIFRASDLFTLDDYSSREQVDRLDDCHVYFITKRPRLSLVPESVDISADTVSFGVEWHVKGMRRQQTLSIPREWFHEAEHSFAISPYPHRELVSYDARGRAVMAMLLANSVHLFEDLPSEVRDLEVVYIGKGLCKSVRDRLVHHETLQRILGDIAAEDPGSEAFVVAHAFAYKKPYLLMRGMPVEITGNEALARHGKAAAYRPSLEEQVSLIEAAAISYFQTSKYNNHYLDFPRRHQRVLRPVYDADFAFLTVQVDHEKIGGQRLYSQKIPPASDHLAFVDFRTGEGRESVLGFRSE